MIDLHTHTDESDGTTSPEELVRQARALGLEALGITDHDTLAGYGLAAPTAEKLGLELICGIELSTRLWAAPERARGKRQPSAHLLGYFLDGPPPPEFRSWIRNWQESRRKRNVELAARLRELGVDIRLEEAQALGGNLTGRPHFAQVLLRKGYVRSIQEAFDVYLGEHGCASVHRDEPTLIEGIRHIRDAGGLPSLAHPFRLPEGRARARLASLLSQLVAAGLEGIEAFYSEHAAEDVELYLSLAAELRLVITGGSDYHGANKSCVRLGTGKNNNLALPYSLLENMRRRIPLPY